MSINKLNYPIFKVTLDEAAILTESLKYLNERNSYYLCRAVESAAGSCGYSDGYLNSLHKKINNSLSGCGTLFMYLSASGNPGFGGYRIRRAWVKKS